MTAKLCLRCDWSGDVGDDICPACGAGLFTTGSAEAPDRPSVQPLPERQERSWGGAAAVVLIAVVALGAVVFVQRHTPPESIQPISTGRPGYLLSSSPEGNGARLWIWDLDANTAAPGPLLDAPPEELVAGYQTHGGWIGVTTRQVGGSRSASILRSVGPSDRPVPVVTGDLLAWAPESSVVSVLHARPVGGCSRLAISTWFVTIRRAVERSVGIRCGAPVAFARDRDQRYVTLQRDAGPTTFLVGTETEPILQGYRLLGASMNGTLLVQRPGQSLAVASRVSIGSTGWTRPLPIGGADDPLDPIRVLGWSTDGSQAFVFGIYRDAQGVYRVPVGDAERRLRPTRLLVTNAVDTQVAPTGDGDVYLLTDGLVSVVHGDAATPITTPPGMPAPLGPILWLATLPYSSTEG
jgi:hypothetical protein